MGAFGQGKRNKCQSLSRADLCRREPARGFMYSRQQPSWLEMQIKLYQNRDTMSVLPPPPLADRKVEEAELPMEGRQEQE
eukprot:1160131-Pelagomonas_calceolata.AAC.11